MTISASSLTIVIPARNEAASLRRLLPELRGAFGDSEIIVVDDGSNDDTADLCAANQVTRVAHPYGKGNGAAIKSGARAARGDYVLFMDADGQHKVSDIPRLLEKLSEGYDMVVGAREADTHASTGRHWANAFYNWFATRMVGHPILDLTSGFRLVERRKFLEFIDLLPNGFSYPTTITMAFFRSGYNVAYIPIRAEQRIGKSHISPLRDGVRFLLIIFKIGTLFSPFKVFVPISAIFLLLGLANYGYTYYSAGRFTNMSALLMSFSVLVFLFGLISEQITNLLYKTNN